MISVNDKDVPGTQPIAVFHSVKYDDGHWEQVAYGSMEEANTFVNMVKANQADGSMLDILAVVPRESFLSIQ